MSFKFYPIDGEDDSDYEDEIFEEEYEEDDYPDGVKQQDAGFVDEVQPWDPHEIFYSIIVND